MKNFFPLVAMFALAAATLTPMTANAQASDDHTVTVTISPINVLTVGADVNLVVNAAAAGSNPTVVTGNSNWSLTTNSAADMKVTAQSDVAMPTGLTLRTNLAAPAGGTSAGFQFLGTSPVDVVNDLVQVAGQNLLMTYEATATVAAALGSPAFVVTYTLTTQ